MTKQTKSAAKPVTVVKADKGAPSPETLAAVPSKRRGKGSAVATMKDKGEASLPNDVKGAITDTRTREQIIFEDVQGSISAVEGFEKAMGALRFGPSGVWTTLVRRFVFNAADWTKVRDTYKSTLTGALRSKAKEANPISAFPGMDETTYNGMIQSLVEQSMQGSYKTTLSQFDVVGRAFLVDKNKKPIGVGRDKILAILEWRETADGRPQTKKLSYKAAIDEARQAVGKSARGRKAGTTNVQKATAPATPAAPGSTAEMTSDPAKIQKLARESAMRSILTFLKGLPDDMVYLSSIAVELANKMKRIDHKETQDMGALLIDYVESLIPVSDVTTQQKKKAA